MNRSLTLLLFFVQSASVMSATTASEVKILPKGAGYEMTRDGVPYFIKGGGGGEDGLESLALAGGNSIRLWGDERLGRILDRSGSLGLTVCAGIWLGQVRQGFDWTDAAALKKQRDHVRTVVEKHKDHPALLVWALGNEMEDPRGKDSAVWSEINKLARMVKEIDPHHPTMTVVAEINGDKVKNFHALCPDVDILGINAYGDGANVAERYRKQGGTKPYILTEFGPNGVWEVSKDAIGAFPEPSSTEKVHAYERAYRGGVLASGGLCLGSYAFIWGQKQEVTSTWFSMFLSDGTRLGAAEKMAELWTGKPPSNRVPAIKSLDFRGDPVGKPGEDRVALLTASDPEGDPVRVAWSLHRDSSAYGSGGEREAVPRSYPEAITKSDPTSAAIRLPNEPGLYRLFATVRDNQGGGAVANVSLRVDGPATEAKGQNVILPLSVYAEDGDPPTYIPAGWMGGTEFIKIDPAWNQNPHMGKTCLRCAFKANEGWAGVVWQNPAGDWGDVAGGYDLTGAKKLTFWARGENGGETVSFEFGTVTRPKQFFDTGAVKLAKVSLTRIWKRYEIDAAGQDLSRIKSGFAWTLTSAGKPVTFYLDDIRWE